MPALITKKNAIRLADIFLVYTMLSPIIFAVIGNYVKLNENFIRTFFLILGPGLIACAIYLSTFRFFALRRNSHIIIPFACLTFIIILSSLKNLDSNYTKESLKFFIAYCALGFLFGMSAKFTIKRARIFLTIWIYYILPIILFCLYLYSNHGYLNSRFTLPGDNPARTAALFFFFTFCGLTNFMLSRTVAPKFFWGFISAICVVIGVASNTRSAILVFGMTLFSYVLFQIFQSETKFERSSLISFMSAFTVVCCLIWFLVIDSNIKNRIITIINLPGQTFAYIFEKDQEAYKNIVRLPILRDAITKFKANPIFGSGFGSEYYSEVIWKKFTHPHNIILQFLAETGIIGLGAFFLFIISVIRQAICSYRSLRARTDKLTYIFLPLSFVFFLMFSCFHFAIHENYFFWYFAGIIVGFETRENGKGSPRKGTELH
jgi:O-antigen ligase